MNRFYSVIELVNVDFATDVLTRLLHVCFCPNWSGSCRGVGYCTTI